ncbi:MULTISPECIES: CIA30 family protein [unclassified Marinobacter]|uniref:CIA30 family protein n=1 Tax=unclassified Marinobacter TaxID=83889 RepID=UPI000BF8ED68|nr:MULTISPECIES: CIA30 family protein [unclassified Marinobacter]PFG10228.1 monofunctional biosynthetic peptidoglycan transglycosylase [Marinobacter sp. LV10MA510-1]PFG52156.1 monofunctional biosynthetic peptidoglycan transglycosylase [Marinobacter sp. LV10R520-4]
MNTNVDRGTILVDFSVTSPAPEWYAVNDGVMGGESRGGPAIVDGRLVFSGQISLENNGGFSSVKSSGHQFDLSACHSLRLRLKGDGRSYQLRLYTDARYGHSPIAYTAEFPTLAGEWTEPVIPIALLSPHFRGRALSGPPLDVEHVEAMGLLLGDKRAGAFELRVEWIRAE